MILDKENLKQEYRFYTEKIKTNFQIKKFTLKFKAKIKKKSLFNYNSEKIW
jgi:hypothetical protein